MSSPGFMPDSINGAKLSQEASDRLHFLKNRPDPPMINGEPLQFPPYEFRPFPAAMYGPFTDEARRRALFDLARANGLNLANELERREAEARMPEYDSRLVHSEAERKDWADRGWADEPSGVKAAQNAAQERVFQAAAEQAFTDRRMTAEAKAEFHAADVANGDMPLVELPAPKKRAGRPKKETAAA